MQPDNAEAIATLFEQANLLYRQGRADESIQVSARAVELAEEACGPAHPQLVFALNNHAMRLLGAGRAPSEVRPYLQRALGSAELCFGYDSPQVARVLHGLGAIEARLGKAGAARASLERAVGIADRGWGPADSRLTRALPRSLELLGSILMSDQRYEDAIPHHVRAIRMREEKGLLDTTLAETYARLGTCLEQTGDRTGATACIARSHDLLQQNLGADHPRTQSAQVFLERLRCGGTPPSG